MGTGHSNSPLLCLHSWHHLPQSSGRGSFQGSLPLSQGAGHPYFRGHRSSIIQMGPSGCVLDADGLSCDVASPLSGLSVTVRVEQCLVST